MNEFVAGIHYKNVNHYKYSNFTEMWLNQHGGRTYRDLLHDPQPYVLMVGSGGEDVKVYLPLFHIESGQTD
jgi:hypothetical protein